MTFLLNVSMEPHCVPVIPYMPFNFFRSREWLIVSNAALRSSKRSTALSRLSIIISKSLCIFKTAVSQSCDFFCNLIETLRKVFRCLKSLPVGYELLSLKVWGWVVWSNCTASGWYGQIFAKHQLLSSWSHHLLHEAPRYVIKLK